MQVLVELVYLLVDFQFLAKIGSQLKNAPNCSRCRQSKALVCLELRQALKIPDFAPSGFLSREALPGGLAQKPSQMHPNKEVYSSTTCGFGNWNPWRCQTTRPFKKQLADYLLLQSNPETPHGLEKVV